MEIRNQTHPELKSRLVYRHHQQLATTISCKHDIRLLPVESALCLFSDQPHCSVIWVSLEAVTTSLLPRMRSATISTIACASSVGWYRASTAVAESADNVFIALPVREFCWCAAADCTQKFKMSILCIL